MVYHKKEWNSKINETLAKLIGQDIRFKLLIYSDLNLLFCISVYEKLKSNEPIKAQEKVKPVVDTEAKWIKKGCS
jgi:hypothetical protein